MRALMLIGLLAASSASAGGTKSKLDAQISDLNAVVDTLRSMNNNLVSTGQEPDPSVSAFIEGLSTSAAGYAEKNSDPGSMSTRRKKLLLDQVQTDLSRAEKLRKQLEKIQKKAPTAASTSDGSTAKGQKTKAKGGKVTMRVEADAFGNLTPASEGRISAEMTEGDSVDVTIRLDQYFGLDGWVGASAATAVGDMNPRVPQLLHTKGADGAISVPSQLRNLYYWTPFTDPLVLLHTSGDEATHQLVGDKIPAREWKRDFPFRATEPDGSMKVKMKAAGVDLTFTISADKKQLSPPTLTDPNVITPTDGTRARNGQLSEQISSGAERCETTPLKYTVTGGAADFKVAVLPMGATVTNQCTPTSVRFTVQSGALQPQTDELDQFTRIDLVEFSADDLTRADVTTCVPDQRLTEIARGHLAAANDVPHGRVVRCEVGAREVGDTLTFRPAVRTGPTKLDVLTQLSPNVAFVQGPTSVEILGKVGGLVKSAASSKVSTDTQSVNVVLKLYEGSYTTEIRSAHSEGGSEVTNTSTLSSAISVKNAPEKMLPVEVLYGFIVRDKGRVIAPLVMLAPQLAPRAAQEWWKRGMWAKQAFKPCAGLRFGGQDDPIGLYAGLQLDAVPGLGFTVGMEFGTQDVTTPWDPVRAISGGIAVDPIALTKAIKLAKSN